MNNQEAEKSLLGSLLLDKDAIHKIIDLIETQDFYEIKHQIIFKTYLDLFTSGVKIDLIILSAELENKGLLQQIGGRSYLVELSNSTATASHITEYAQIVKDKSLRRQIIKAQHENEQIVKDENKEINLVLAEVQNKIVAISPLHQKNDSIQQAIQDLGTIQNQYAEKYKEGKKYIGIPCGFEKIDNAIDGLRPGHLWILGGWHGTGKTSLALNFIHNVIEQCVPCSIISLEMSPADLTAKLIGIRHLLSSAKIIKGINDWKTKENIDEGKAFLNQSNLDIHTEFDLEKIKMQIRKDVYTRKIKVVMIDYLQKFTHEKIYEETPLMSKAAKDLSNLAQELQITIIALSQISNETQKGQGAGAGFKGSGTIEASADLAIRIKRDKSKEEAGEYVDVDVVITKNKFGFDGSCQAKMHLPSGKFEMLSL